MSRKAIIRALPTQIYAYTFIGTELTIFYRKGEERTLKEAQRNLLPYRYHVAEVERDNPELDAATFRPMYIN